MRFEHWFYTAPLRLRSLFRRRQVEQELDEELRYHLEQKIEQYSAQGLAPGDARRAALRAMDGLTQRKEECRDAWGVNLIDNFIQDVRYSLRALAKAPGFTLVAVATLALAIGANAVVFGILDALLRPLNLPRADSLWAIQRGTTIVDGYQSYPDYIDMRDRNRSFTSLAVYSIAQVGIDTGAHAARAWVYETSGNYFDTLGIQPYLGRFFHASDEHGPNSAPYVVLSYAYWNTHFPGDRAVPGRIVRLNKHPFTVLGVAPPDFRGTLMFFSPDLFTPIVNQQQIGGVNTLNVRSDHWVWESIGHLKAGVTPAQAVADLNSIGVYLEKTYPNDDGPVSLSLVRPGLYGDFLGRPVRAFVTALMLLAALILLAACANLGSLFAARAADRSREVALRLALGSSRRRILQRLLTEAVLISLAGGVAGLWGSIALLRWLAVWRPLPKFPINVPVSPDATVYVIALGLALASGLLFGIVPVRQVLQTDPYQIVKSGTRSTAGRIAIREVLLVVQIAICAVLVTASMVAVRGLSRSLHADFGFRPSHAMLVYTDLNMAGYRGDAVPAMQKRMIDAMAAIPGVRAVGLVDNPPLTEGWNTSIVFTDRTTDLRPANAAATVVSYSISPGYNNAAGTTILTGRDLSWHDDENAPPVALVNAEFARRLFGSVTSALDRYYKLRDGTRVQIVGILEDGKYTTNLAEKRQPAMFRPILQVPGAKTSLVVRWDGDPHHIAAAIRGAVRGLDRELPVFIESWKETMDGALFAPRMATASLGVLGVMGAMLAITGIFGMAAYSVSKRLRELGIRLALGAQRTQVLDAALGRALRLLAIGSAAGLTLGVLASRVLAHIVYQATPRDPFVLGGAILAMALVGLLATWIPAQRALSLDPVTLLREE
jgi:predicted permease